LKITEDPLSIYLHHGGRNVVYFDLKPDKDGYLEYIEVEIEAELLSMTFDLTRTAVNDLLDNLQGRVWLPLSIMRIDLYVKGEPYPLAHQLILPYPVGLNEDFLKGVQKISDLFNKFSELRNRVAHFFLKNDDRPLLFSHGPTYYEYSLAGAVLLYHSNLAYKELANYFTQKLSGKLARGMILPLKKNKDQFILRPKQ